MAKTAIEYKLKAVKNESFECVKITGSKSTADYARQFYESDIDIYESFFLILLNRGNRVTGWVKISQGGVAGTVCDTVLIAKYAIESLAKGVILVHNHPSGNTEPSNADTNITEKVKQALQLFDIQVLDHVILTSDSFYSFADDGKI